MVTITRIFIFLVGGAACIALYYGENGFALGISVGFVIGTAFFYFLDRQSKKNPENNPDENEVKENIKPLIE